MCTLRPRIFTISLVWPNTTPLTEDIWLILCMFLGWSPNISENPFFELKKSWKDSFQGWSLVLRGFKFFFPALKRHLKNLTTLGRKIGRGSLFEGWSPIWKWSRFSKSLRLRMTGRLVHLVIFVRSCVWLVTFFAGLNGEKSVPGHLIFFPKHVILVPVFVSQKVINWKKQELQVLLFSWYDLLQAQPALCGRLLVPEAETLDLLRWPTGGGEGWLVSSRPLFSGWWAPWHSYDSIGNMFGSIFVGKDHIGEPIFQKMGGRYDIPS